MKIILFNVIIFYIIIYLVLVDQEVTILFSWIGNGAYSQMFYAIFQFCAQVKFATFDGNPAIVFYLQPVQDHCSWSEQSLFPVEKDDHSLVKFLL